MVIPRIKIVIKIALAMRITVAVADPGASDLGFAATEFTFVFPETFKESLRPHGCLTVEPSLIAFGGYRAASQNQAETKRYSYDWTEAALDAQLKVDAKILGHRVASADVMAKYRAANINTALSFAMVSEFNLEAGTRYLTSFTLKEPYKAMADNFQDAYLQYRESQTSAAKEIMTKASLRFYLACGDRFVAQQKMGSKLSRAIRVSFKDNRALLDFLVIAKAKILGVKKKQEKHEYYDRHLTNSLISIDLIQEGGDQKAFADFKVELAKNLNDTTMNCVVDSFNFGETGDATEEFKAKVSDEIEQCARVWSTIESYAQHDYAAQIAHRDSDHLAVTAEHFQTYDSVGILAFPLYIPPDARKALEALNKLGKLSFDLQMIASLADELQRRLDRLNVPASGLKNFKGTVKMHQTDLGQRLSRCVDSIKRDANNMANECAPSTIEPDILYQQLLTMEQKR